MTVVTRFDVDGHPVFISDLLISSEDDTSSARLPTLGAIDQIFPKGSGFVPTGLRQKTAILSPSVVIGWSGSALSARTYLTTLKEIARNQELTIEIIEQTTRDLDHQGLINELTTLGAHWNLLKSTVETFGIPPCKKARSDNYGSVYLIGGGWNWFGAFMETGNDLTIVPPDDKSLRAALTGQAIAGAGAALEVDNGFSLLEYFGGGYEVTTLWANGFRKLEGVTNLVWRGESFKAPVEFSISHVSKGRYINDFLNIQVLRPGADDSQSADAVKHHRTESFLIPPAYRPIITPATPSFNIEEFNSSIICHYFVVGPESQRQCKAQVEFYSETTQNISFSNSKSGPSIILNKQWMQDLLDSIAE